MSLPRPAPARAMVWACVVACALLLAQTLGLMHGVVHGPQARAQGYFPVNAPAQNLDPVAGHGASRLAPLFSAHGGDPDCRLFDQASHGSTAPGIVSLSLPMVLAALVFDISRSEALARWAALFDARGPPLTR